MAVELALNRRVTGTAMKLLDRLFRPAPVAPPMLALWHAVVAQARDKRWYLDLGVADNVEGRFDMVTLILAMVLLRLEREGDGASSVALTELFIEDMDSQLRQSGVGDLMVGKRVGKLMATLGGRVGALRETLPAGGAALAEAVARNVSLLEGASPAPLADELLRFHAAISDVPFDRLVAGKLTT
jgi:cytochrome b pre-mRNA-processing protein 3